MNILICDDIHDEAVKLEEAVKTSGFEARCVLFNSGEDAFAHIQSGTKVDVCFLDILMPEMKGTELAKKMRGAQFKGEIVFLTTTNEYACESYEVGAYSYLLKPPNAQTVAKILSGIAEAQKSADTGGIPISTRTLTRFLFFREISHVEVKGHNVCFRLLDGGEIEVNAALSEFLPKLLEDRRFAQCHRSFVVNMDAVSQIHGREVFLRCGRKAPISKNFMEFDKIYLKRIFGKEK